LDEATGARAVAQGAALLERHLTHDRAAPGPDHAASLDRGGMSRYIAGLPRVVPPIGPVRDERDRKRVLACEQDVRRVSRQSVVARADIPGGTRLTRSMLTFKRPGTGLAPFQIDEVIARRAARSIPADRPITPDDLA
jgi:sialic acid synthase SpsE